MHAPPTSWRRLCMHHIQLAWTTHAPHQQPLILLWSCQRSHKKHPPLPFSLVIRSLPASFLSFLFLFSCLSPHAWPSCCTVRFNCSCFSLASGITFFAKIYIQGTVGPWHIRLENVRKKKAGKTFPGRESVSVPRQGTSKRPRQGLASVPRQGACKRTQAGYWQASQAGTANVPRQGTIDIPRQGTVAVPRPGTVGTARKMHSNDLPPIPRHSTSQPVVYLRDELAWQWDEGL